MSPISINQVFRHIPTNMDLNGPLLGFLEEPESLVVSPGTAVTFVGVGTVFFKPTSDNVSTDGSNIIYQWYENTSGIIKKLNDNSEFTGTGTTTLTISGSTITSPQDSGRSFYLELKHQDSGIGTPMSRPYQYDRETGLPKAQNEPLISRVGILTVTPTISITSQPQNTIAGVSQDAFFSVSASLSDTTQGDISYQWTANGEPIPDSNSPNLTYSTATSGITTVRVIITHPTSAQSPVYSNVAELVVTPSRKIIRFEGYSVGSPGSVKELNLAEEETITVKGPTVQGTSISSNLVGFLSPERDLVVELEMRAGTGSASGSNRAGEGGRSVVRFTMKQNEEYIVAGLSARGAIFMYRKASILFVIGRGGSASSNGRGGDGGGVNVAGERAPGSGGGDGGELIPEGQMSSSSGQFGSATAMSSSFVGQYGDSVASSPRGGILIACPRGNRQNPPCYNYPELTQFVYGNNTVATNSAFAERGFKQGYGIRQNAGGGGGGGQGGEGGAGGDGGTSGYGGGGGSGYFHGAEDVTILETQQGGGDEVDSYMIFRDVNPLDEYDFPSSEYFIDTDGRVLIGSHSDTSINPANLTKTTGRVVPGDNAWIDDERWQYILTVSQVDSFRLAITLDGETSKINNDFNPTRFNLKKMRSFNTVFLPRSLTDWNDSLTTAGSVLCWASPNDSFATRDASGIFWNNNTFFANFGYRIYSNNSDSDYQIYDSSVETTITSANFWLLPPAAPGF
tara:strand:- start:3306 stop:5519 length:2214 start_codon:yes stop_codon:yes gene_type:complete